MNSRCSPENGKLSQRAILVHFEKALKEEQFLVYYQPIYNHSTGMLVGMEALVRWRHPEFGMIPPLDFIPVLEDENLIPHLDLYVFDKACRFLKKSGGNVACNASDFRQHCAARHILPGLCGQNGTDPSCLRRPREASQG